MFGKMNKKQKILTLASVIVIVVALIGSLSWALLFKESSGITNTFKAAGSGAEIIETFDNNIKQNVNIKNTGTMYGYVRIKLITYRINDNGDIIGGTAEIPDFSADMGEGWFDMGDNTYVYSKAVAPNSKPATDLIGSTGIELKKYTDTDGGKQVVDVVGEIIQSTPSDAVVEAWGVEVDKDGILSLKEDD